MKLSVYNTENQRVGDIDLDDSVFAAPVKSHLFWEVVRNQLASRRAGTHKTKRIPEVRGTGKKPYRQKGTGRARHGSMRAVGMRKGAVAHGPSPRDYSYSVPKKVVKGALRSALSLRNGEKRLVVIQGWRPERPKTSAAEAVLQKFQTGRTLVVDSSSNVTLARSVRNLPNAKFLPVEALNVYDLLAHDHLILSFEAAKHLSDRLRTEPSRSERARAAGERK